MNENESWRKSEGPDCSNICDIVYFIMCDSCKYEAECHDEGIDHDKMLDCALVKLQAKLQEELDDIKLINQTIEELEKLDFVKSVDVDNYKCVNIHVNVTDDNGWIDRERSKTIHGMYYNLLKLLKNSVSVDININSGD